MLVQIDIEKLKKLQRDRTKRRSKSRCKVGGGHTPMKSTRDTIKEQSVPSVKIGLSTKSSSKNGAV